MIDDKTAMPVDRRTFLKTTGAAALAMGMPMPISAALAANARVGVDAFSLGAQQWTPFQTLEWAAKMKVQMIHFSEVRFLGSPRWQEALAPDNLKRVRDKADELKVDIEIGMRSICPTAADFANAQRNDPTLGTADEQIARMLTAAKAVRSPIVRCVQGTGADRTGPIEKHMAETVRVLKANRSRILDSGVKLAIENHAGDMQGRELRQIIEEAGPDIVGVCLDTGNPFWAAESPHVTMDQLGQYALTSHFRDSYCFNSPQGIASAWVRSGDGNIGMEDLIRKYLQKAPGKAVSLEIIVQANNFRIFNYRDPAAWTNYKTTPASEFAQLLALAEKGVPKELPPPGQGRAGGGAGGAAAGAGRAGGAPGGAPAAAAGAAPAGAPGGGGQGRGGAPNPEAQARNLADVEASVTWTQECLARI